MKITETTKCHICGYSGEYICDICGLPYCEDCEADNEANVEIESPCCKECESIYLIMNLTNK